MISGWYSAAFRIWSVVLIEKVRRESENSPFGRFAFMAARAVCTSSRFRSRLFKSVGLTSTRTAGSELPPTNTWPTPWTCASFWARMDEATSYILPFVARSDVRSRIRIGASAGFTLR